MYLEVAGKVDWLVKFPNSFLGARRPLVSLPFEGRVFSFWIPRERWDEEFFKLQGG